VGRVGADDASSAPEEGELEEDGINEASFMWDDVQMGSRTDRVGKDAGLGTPIESGLKSSRCEGGRIKENAGESLTTESGMEERSTSSMGVRWPECAI
jgi:hypothetical protein